MQNHAWPIFSPIVTYSSATSYVPQDKIPRYEIPPPPQPVRPDNATNYADLAPLSYPQMDTSKLVYAPIVRRKDLQQKIDAAKAGGSSKKTSNGKKIGARNISRPPGNIPLKNPEFPAIAVKTKQGKHPLLIYRSKINNDNCYSFHFKKINGRGDAKTFVCNGCKNKKKTLHIMASLDTTYFLKCPETLPHICKPTSWRDQFADRELFGTPDEEPTPEKKPKRDKRKLEEDTHLGMAEEESEVM